MNGGRQKRPTSESWVSEVARSRWSRSPRRRSAPEVRWVFRSSLPDGCPEVRRWVFRSSLDGCPEVRRRSSARAKGGCPKAGPRPERWVSEVWPRKVGVRSLARSLAGRSAREVQWVSRSQGVPKPGRMGVPKPGRCVGHALQAREALLAPVVPQRHGHRQSERNCLNRQRRRRLRWRVLKASRPYTEHCVLWRGNLFVARAQRVVGKLRR